MDIKDLIKSKRIELGLTMKELGDAVGVSEATISRYESGQIANMKRTTIIALSKVLSIPTARFIECDDENQLSNGFQAAKKNTYRVPLLGTIAAGAPILADDHIEDYIEISLDVKADFALRVQGDSMIDANIHDGDIVFIHQQPSVENGEIAAVMLIDETTSDGIATLKRVYKTPNGLQLIPENRNYAPIIIDQSNGEGAKLLGKATYHVTQVR